MCGNTREVALRQVASAEVAQQRLPQGKAGAATRCTAVGLLADRHLGKAGHDPIAEYLRDDHRGPYPLVNNCKSIGKRLAGKPAFL